MVFIIYFLVNNTARPIVKQRTIYQPPVNQRADNKNAKTCAVFAQTVAFITGKI
jgi:hypothetical protein